jgi:hypothetical protein
MDSSGCVLICQAAASATDLQARCKDNRMYKKKTSTCQALEFAHERCPGCCSQWLECSYKQGLMGVIANTMMLD